MKNASNRYLPRATELCTLVQPTTLEGTGWRKFYLDSPYKGESNLWAKEALVPVWSGSRPYTMIVSPRDGQEVLRLPALNLSWAFELLGYRFMKV